MEKKNYEMEDRFVNYACLVMDIVESLPNSISGGFVGSQLIRCGYAPAFDYAEVQHAGSRTEFIQKIGGILKELKECRTLLKIIRKKELLKNTDKLDTIYEETEALIAIIGKSVSTAKKNRSTVVAG